MITVITRMVLQIRARRRLSVDDYFLVLACISLTVRTALGYTNVGNIYFTQDLNLNPSLIVSLISTDVDVAARIIAYQRLYYTYPALLWTTIFAVKFAHLAFFRQLVDRVRPLVIYWRFIVGTTIIAYPVCIISIYVACMEWGADAGQSLPQNHQFIMDKILK